MGYKEGEKSADPLMCQASSWHCLIWSTTFHSVFSELDLCLCAHIQKGKVQKAEWRENNCNISPHPKLWKP